MTVLPTRSRLVGNTVRTSRHERVLALKVAAALRVGAVIVLRITVQAGNCIQSRSLRYTIISIITAEVYTWRNLYHKSTLHVSFGFARV
jgi:hypothetical protein